jgi:hypothetical protein
MRFDDFVWAREPDKYVVDGNPVALNHNNICVNIWWCNYKKEVKMHFPKIMCNERKMYYRDIKKFIIYYFIRR